MFFNVFIGSKLVEQVWYQKGFTCQEVRESLIRHDGFSSEIKVYKGN